MSSRLSRNQSKNSCIAISKAMCSASWCTFLSDRKCDRHWQLGNRSPQSPNSRQVRWMDIKQTIMMWTPTSEHYIMFIPYSNEMHFIGLFLEGFFCGLYSGIFIMYIQYKASKKDSNKTQNLIFCAICALYVLSVALFVTDIANVIFQFPSMPDVYTLLRISFIQATSFGCCDFIAQCILIYRCWIVWGRNIRVVIIPSIVAIAFLAIWIVGGNSMYISSGELLYRSWAYSTTLSGLAMSLTVNALVTGLIVLRILKVFHKVKATSDDRILGASGGNKLRQTIMILIESGMALFSIQLARLVVSIVSNVKVDAANRALSIIVGIHEMLNGITPTIILVRISMGLSFDEERSMEEVAIGTLRFASSQLDTIQEAVGGTTVAGKDSNDNRY